MCGCYSHSIIASGCLVPLHLIIFHLVRVVPCPCGVIDSESFVITLLIGSDYKRLLGAGNGVSCNYSSVCVWESWLVACMPLNVGELSWSYPFQVRNHMLRSGCFCMLLCKATKPHLASHSDPKLTCGCIVMNTRGVWGILSSMRTVELFLDISSNAWRD